MREIRTKSACVVVTPASGAESFPQRPVRVIVPFGAGGTTDLTARVIGPAMTQRLGQPVIVENRAGAGGNLGSEACARLRESCMWWKLMVVPAGNLYSSGCSVDLPPADLLRRLEEGKVYLPERAATAVHHFFRESNLTALRELSLRLVADHVGVGTRGWRGTQSDAGTWKTEHRLLVAVGFGANLQPGQLLFVNSYVGKEAMTRAVAHAAYTRGARYVDVIRGFLHQYRESLPADRRVLVEQYRFVHMARKVVGVGSVGTRAWVVLLIGRDDHDPLVLQLKEAQQSVLAPGRRAPS